MPFYFISSFEDKNCVKNLCICEERGWKEKHREEGTFKIHAPHGSLPQVKLHPSDVLMTIQQDATPIWTGRIGEDSLPRCALICWLTAERQHCLLNVRRVRGHCIAFVRSVVEVTLSSGPSCCGQLGHATYIDSNYPCQPITTVLVPSHSSHTQIHTHVHIYSI